MRVSCGDGVRLEKAPQRRGATPCLAESGIIPAGRGASVNSSAEDDDKLACYAYSGHVHSEPIILPSAYRHGVSEESVIHVLTYPVRSFVQDDGMTMIIGPDFDGTLIEVGLIEWHGSAVVAHALRPARTRFLR